MSHGTDDVQQVIATLATAPDGPDGWTAGCRRVLGAMDGGPGEVLAHLSALPATELQIRFDGSHETSTHYKWLVHRSYRPRFTVWLHEYKDAAERRYGYAEVPHDHRYAIGSRILRGGYTAVEWNWDGHGLTERARTTFRAGDVMTLDTTGVHSLCDIEDGTLTLVVEGPPRRSYSTAYPRDVPVRYRDFPGRWPDLTRKLTGPDRGPARS